MNPDLNQLRRDLRMNSHASSRSQPETIIIDSETADEPPAQSGISLSSVGTGLLTILGIAVGLWLLADPICMLLLGIWQLICAVITFIFQVIFWIIVGFIVLSVIGKSFG